MENIKKFIEAVIEGRFAEVNEMLNKNRALANSFGQVRADHREFMKRENSDGGWTALHLAAHYGHEEIVKLLVELGANINQYSQNDIKNTPLMAAIAGGNAKIVLNLLRAGANPSLKDGSGITAVELAKIDQQSEIENVLKKFE